MRTYVNGQLGPLERKSVEPMALEAGTPPRTLQEFLAIHRWDERKVSESARRGRTGDETSGDRVTFRCKATGTGRTTTMTLHPHEFMRRFLQHVLPKRFHRVRYFGLWSGPWRAKRRRLQLALGGRLPAPDPEDIIRDDAPAPRHPLEGMKCPRCGEGRLVHVRELPQRRDIPP